MAAREIYYSAGIYRSSRNHKMIFIPYGFDKDGLRKGINKPQILEEAYSPSQIGQILKECLQMAINKRYTEEDLYGWALLEAAGYKSNSKFVKEYLSVSVVFNMTSGYEIKPTTRDRGGYSGSKDDPVDKLFTDATDKEIGESVLRMFEFSR